MTSLIMRIIKRIKKKISKQDGRKIDGQHAASANLTSVILS
jgi:hypothetical protein